MTATGHRYLITWRFRGKEIHRKSQIVTQECLKTAIEYAQKTVPSYKDYPLVGLNVREV
jgi:hypothetical protein